VAAQDAERRKLERNLHDGAQRQLVALTLQLHLAERFVGKDPGKERVILSGLASLSNDALEDLRDLARGIYPPLPADKGLGAALASQARKAVVATSVETDGVGRYDQDIEAAVYFCALEALNNVAKYAEATRATIAVEAPDGALTFRVTDDGKGFDVGGHDAGTGLQGMRDRLDAIGGSSAS
jgi:signal transduction histidine kinase